MDKIIEYASQNDLEVVPADMEHDWEKFPEHLQTNLHKKRIEDGLTEEYCVYDNNNKMVAFMGLQPINITTSEIWGYILDKEYKKTSTKLARYMADIWKEDFGRIQSFVEKGNESAKKFNKFLGLEVEAELKNFKENKNYIIMSWTEEK